eukprot:scaffold22740_cov129-Isochrysis_galbana.AAC.3
MLFPFASEAIFCSQKHQPRAPYGFGLVGGGAPDSSAVHISTVSIGCAYHRHSSASDVRKAAASSSTRGSCANAV